jgi:shikimate dehydrogenase
MELPRSVLAGLIGAGIQKSRTPRMHELEGSRQGLRYIYRLVDLETFGGGPELLGELLANAERLGFDGFNITHPCKQAVIPHLTELSEEVRDIGACNTVVLRDGKRIGHNTDWWGYEYGFRQQLADVPLDRVLQIGAGGAGSAVAYALMKMGAGRLTIADLNAERAKGLAEHLNGVFGGSRVGWTTDAVSAAPDVQGVVQATFIGQVGHEGTPIPKEALKPEHWVSEIIYFPIETELLAHARAIGCRTADATGMAVGQAIRAIELIAGVNPDREAMTRDFFAMGKN